MLPVGKRQLCGHRYVARSFCPGQSGSCDRLEMMARELALWPVDHSDRPFEQRQRQSFGQLSPYSLTPVREAAGKTGAAESLDSFVRPRRAAGSLIAGEKCSEVFEHNRPRHYEICRPFSCER